MRRGRKFLQTNKFNKNLSNNQYLEPSLEQVFQIIDRELTFYWSDGLQGYRRWVREPRL